MNFPRERLILIGVGVLVVLGLIFAGVSTAQRSAYMEGYLMGRLSAPAAAVTGGAVAGGAVAAAPVPAYPVAPYVVGYPDHGGPGPFGFLFLLLGIGAVFFVFRRMAMVRAWAMHGGYPGGPGAGPQGWHHGPPPWAQERMRRCWEQGNAAPQAAQSDRQPSAPETTSPSGEPGATPAADR